MKKLIDGILRFQSYEFYPRRNYFQDLIKGEKPRVMLITCSDSCINPHMLTQSEPGELFILRNAGNIVPAGDANSSGEIATIEYALAELEIQHIIICGHSHCGAMQRLLDPDEHTDLPALSNWLRHAESARRVVEHKYKHLNDDERLLETAKMNVLAQLNNLRTIPIIRSKIALRRLQLHGWVYIIESGEVLAYDETNKQFLPLIDEPLTMKAYAI